MIMVIAANRASIQLQLNEWRLRAQSATTPTLINIARKSSLILHASGTVDLLIIDPI
jgi:hypothetical protein